MRKGLLVSAVGLTLVGGAARAQGQATSDQNSDSNWDGPGFYAEDFTTAPSDGSHMLFKEGGPFSSADSCQAYLQQYLRTATQGPQDSYRCTYRGSFVKYDSCFLTTACVEHAGLADDCEELTVMRAFRDSHLRRFDEGRQLIEHYYAIAPQIVRAIQASHERERVLDWILHQVRETARAVGRGDSNSAIARYAAMVVRLQQRYGVA